MAADSSLKHKSLCFLNWNKSETKILTLNFSSYLRLNSAKKRGRKKARRIDSLIFKEKIYLPLIFSAEFDGDINSWLSIRLGHMCLGIGESISKFEVQNIVVLVCSCGL